MEKNFMDEEQGKDFPENAPERNPAPSVEGKNEPKTTKKKEKKIRWWYVVVAISIAVLSFLGGYLTNFLSLDGEIRTLLSVKKGIQQNYYKEVTDEDFYDAVFDGINENLLDSYSEYMTPDEYAAALSDLQGNREGMGLVFYADSQTPLRVIRVCGNSPAEAAGIVAGEEIVACGVDEENLTACKTFEDLNAVIGGFASGEEFFLQVRSAEEVRNVKLHKSAYVENYVFYRTSTKSYSFAGEKATEMVEKGAPMPYLSEDTAYIRLVQFTGNAAQEFADAMTKFKADGKKNLIIDLRDNGGGYLDVMQSISAYFCKEATEEKPIVAMANFADHTAVYRATGNSYKQYFQEDSRICVLADSGTASASECLIGCMIDYGAMAYGDVCLAERNGVAKTYGKGIMQETRYVDVIKKDALKLTTAEIVWPKGTSIHDRGVLPKDGALTVEENVDYEEETRRAIEKLWAE